MLRNLVQRNSIILKARGDSCYRNHKHLAAIKLQEKIISKKFLKSESMSSTPLTEG